MSSYNLHRRYAGVDAEALADVATVPADRLSRWAIDYLRSAEDRSLTPMLEAAVERRYSADPNETFFTGGGVHRFSNFKHEDDAEESDRRRSDRAVGESRLRAHHARRRALPCL